MRSRRDQVQAHAYVVGRLTSALVHGEPDAPESPLRRTGLGSFGGLLLGTLAVAAFLVWGLISAGDKPAVMTAGELVMAKETGARYIYADHELRPVMNWSSAMLLTGGNAVMTAVPAATLTGIPQGQPIGIVGAPDSLPAANAIDKGAWLVCALSAGRPQVSLTIGIQVPVSRLPSNGALLVRAQDTEYLIWHGQRLKLDASWIPGALGLGRAPVTKVSPAWLNAVPAGPDLRPIDVSGRGEPGPMIGAVHTKVGQVLVTSNVGSPDEFYLAQADALVPITAAQAAIVLGDPSSSAAGGLVRVSPASMVHAPMVRRTLADAADAPSAPPRDESAAPGVPCMRYLGAGGTAPQFVFATPPTGLPPALNSPGVTGSPQTADLIRVVPGGGGLVRPLAAPGVGGGSLFLVTDAGVKFAVPSASAASALGYRAGRAIAVPAALLGLLPTGPALNLAPMRR
ncbi:MAG TPA: type VII secretion protein EccB [Streptosporangiaceae bacterium]|nr:type VII secretion protein EccB [Streptosporangiaceae bacterium]